jgi:hypothetical protein
MLGKNWVSISSSPTTEKSNLSLNTKMSSKHILETAKTSQLNWGTFEKKGVLRVISPLPWGFKFHPLHISDFRIQLFFSVILSD